MNEKQDNNQVPNKNTGKGSDGVSNNQDRGAKPVYKKIMSQKSKNVDTYTKACYVLIESYFTMS